MKDLDKKIKMLLKYGIFNWKIINSPVRRDDNHWRHISELKRYQKKCCQYPGPWSNGPLQPWPPSRNHCHHRPFRWGFDGYDENCKAIDEKDCTIYVHNVPSNGNGKSLENRSVTAFHWLVFLHSYQACTRDKATMSKACWKKLTYPGAEPGEEEEGGEDDDADGGEGDQANHLPPAKGEIFSREWGNACSFRHLSLLTALNDFLQIFLKIFPKLSKVIFPAMQTAYLSNRVSGSLLGIWGFGLSTTSLVLMKHEYIDDSIKSSTYISHTIICFIFQRQLCLYTLYILRTKKLFDLKKLMAW